MSSEQGIIRIKNKENNKTHNESFVILTTLFRRS